MLRTGLKVAIITLGTYPLSTGGVQVHSYYHAKQLSEAGCGVAVITRPARSVRRIETGIPGVRIEVVGSSVPLFGQLSFIFRALWKLFEIRPDVVHVHLATYFPAPAYLFSVLTGTPYVVSCHGFDIITLRRRAAWKAIQKILFRRAAKVTTASSELKFMLLTEYRLPESKVEVVSNGVEISEIDGLMHGKAENGSHLPKRIGYLANLRPVKDPLLALSAFGIIRQKHEEVQLVIMGGGELKGEMLRRIKNEGMPVGSVIMKGELAHHDAMAELAKCDIFLLTSKEEGGNPLSLMEAMAMEKPVVATNVGGVKDVIVNRVNGLLVSDRSPESFAEAVNVFLDDEALARRVAAQARVTAEHYTWKKVVGEYVLIYVAMISAKGRPR